MKSRVDFMVAIACQETGDVRPILRKKPLTTQPVVALCVGDTLDSDRGRKAVGGELILGSLRTRNELVRVSTTKNGPVAVTGVGAGMSAAPAGGGAQRNGSRQAGEVENLLAVEAAPVEMALPQSLRRIEPARLVGDRHRAHFKIGERSAILS